MEYWGIEQFISIFLYVGLGYALGYIFGNKNIKKTSEMIVKRLEEKLDLEIVDTED